MMELLVTVLRGFGGASSILFPLWTQLICKGVVRYRFGIFQFLFGWKWTFGAGNPPASHSKITDSPSAAVWLSGSWNSTLSLLQSRTSCCCSFEYIWRWYLGKIWRGMDGQADGIRLCNPDSIWRLTRVVPFVLIVHVLYHKCLSVIVIRCPTLR